MPELPEVETIKRDLIPKIVGRCFTRVALSWTKAVHQPSADEFCRRLVGQTIKGLARRGKYLILHLSSGEALIFHLRMSGWLLLRPADYETDPYTRATFDLDNGTQLRLCDVRKLGVLWLVKDENSVVKKLGPEPLEPSFTPEVLASHLAKHTAPIKAVLCDQSFLAGIGNMYADESLYAARIHPLRKANSLSEGEVERLHSAMGQVLQSAISHKGATMEDLFYYSSYRTPCGQPGTAQFFFCVAHRLGEPCPTCGTPIKRIPLRKRGTYFCPRCQPTP